MADDITTLIHAAAGGDASSNERLMSLIYRDLLRLARSRLAKERTYTDLNASSLVHEAYLRFARSIPQDVASRRVFFAYAARAMESVIVDHVRRRSAKKRGEGVAEVTLATGMEGEQATYSGDQVEALYAAMQRLERVDPALHEIVHLRYYAGMTIEQVAELLDWSTATVKRRWKEAMTILRHTLDRGAAQPQ
jgi:RNA polymerase sigma factor (TIGR02999 family)